MEQEIINYLNDHGQEYLKISNQQSLEIIYNLLIKHIIPYKIVEDEAIIYFYHSIYYCIINDTWC